jgi:hypothetical protein
MNTIFNFPKRVTVRVSPPIEGLAVSLLFGMRKKNKFGYIIFTNILGIGEVAREELLHIFDEERSFFIMDYVDPRTNFSGEITAKVLSRSDLDGALKALGLFRDRISFPPGYEKNLGSAIARRLNPDDYKVEVMTE